MRHVRMLGLCLVAVFAIAAIAATSASALPEFGQCYAKAGGKYADSNCTVKASKGTGTFEWLKGLEASNTKFEGHNVGSGGVLTTEFAICQGGVDQEVRLPRKECEENGGSIVSNAGSLRVECESESNHGENTGTKEVKNVSVIFRGCKLFGTIPCSNAPTEGEVLVNTLKGTLGYINKANKEVGLLLEPAKKKTPFAKFVCGGLVNTVGAGNAKEGAAYSPEATGGYDGLISSIGPVNTMTKGLTQTFIVNEANENLPNKFEGKHIELLEDFIINGEHPNRSSLWLKAGETIVNENVTESGAEEEIKA